MLARGVTFPHHVSDSGPSGTPYFSLGRGVGSAKTTLRTTPAKMDPDHAGLSRIHPKVSHIMTTKIAPTTRPLCIVTQTLMPSADRRLLRDLDSRFSSRWQRHRSKKWPPDERDEGAEGR